jgi:ribonuclease BN (tRNA processing enzyme)
VKVTIVGCSGTFPGPESCCSAYLFEADGFRMLVDAGNGATGALQQHIGILDLDAVVISHLHGDHYLDLVTYTYARRYHPDGCPGPVPVYGPDGTRTQIAAAYARPVDALLDSVSAMRIAADGGSLTYSADTGVSAALVELAKGTDVLLCEASYLDGDHNPPDVHLTGGEAGEHATRAGAGRLVLTHLVPWGDSGRSLEAAHTTYDGEIGLAATGNTFDV